MNAHKTYPKIAEVTPRPGKRLWVRFRNGAARLYDCTPLLRNPVFHPLRDEALFKTARADAHGYGVVWTNELDLAESEIWLHGRPAAVPASMVREVGATEPRGEGTRKAKRRRRAVKYPTAQKRRG